jgi:uncharacterized membrane protein YraQ (UPF0718 family)
MPGNVMRLSFSLVSIFLVSFFLVLLMNPQVLQTLPAMEHPDLQTFKTMFISITLEAFPFILLGVLVSSIIQVFIPEWFIRRLIPKNPVLGVITASLLGVVFPVCECGMVPVARRLIHKGFPVYAAVVFLLAGPIVNPVVFSATFMAFRSNPSITYSRMGLAVAVAVVAGLVIYRFVRYNPMKEKVHSRTHEHDQGHQPSRSGNRLIETFDHASGEFFDMGKYLIFGAFLTALVQTFVAFQCREGGKPYEILGRAVPRARGSLLCGRFIHEAICRFRRAVVSAGSDSYRGSFLSGSEHRH